MFISFWPQIRFFKLSLRTHVYFPLGTSKWVAKFWYVCNFYHFLWLTLPSSLAHFFYFNFMYIGSLICQSICTNRFLASEQEYILTFLTRMKIIGFLLKYKMIFTRATTDVKVGLCWSNDINSSMLVWIRLFQISYV